MCDWTDIVVADDAADALGLSYEKWVTSANDVPVPGQCAHSILPGAAKPARR
ncbi:hypothetical protein BH10PSE14_BH10PSE14_45240 [soil metagenome]